MTKPSGAPTWLAAVAALSLAACGAEPKEQAHLAAHATGQQTEALKAGECDLDGTWAIRITVPVRWNGSAVLQGGDGELIQYVKATRTRNGSVIHESLGVCGIVLPDYKSKIWQKFATQFPEELFDNGLIDNIEVDSHYSSFAPGATFDTNPVVSELGVALPSALTDPWPLRGTDLKHAVDSDQDGHPGVTLKAATGDGYSLPPTVFPNFSPAKRFYAAIRNIAKIDGTQQTCDLATGSAIIPKIGNKLALNSHVLGCELAAGGHCDAGQTRLLDTNQPGYQLQEHHPGTVIMVRIDDDATCQTVRETPFP